MVVCQLFPAAMRAALGLGMTTRRFPPPWSVEETDAASSTGRRRLRLLRGAGATVGGHAAHPRRLPEPLHKGVMAVG
jgi:hypothetical protein